MTDLDLDAIEARAQAATPGPWYWEPKSDESWPQSDQSLRSSGAKATMPDGRPLGIDEVILSGWGYDASGIEGEDHDREFIAHAREDIPALAAEVRSLRAQLAKVEEAWWRGMTQGDTAYIVNDDQIDLAMTDIWAALHPAAEGLHTAQEAPEINEEPTALAAPYRTERCGCPMNEIGDVPCHRCGQFVNVRCWNCGTPRGDGPCPSRTACTEPHVCPECAAGKHRNCSNEAWCMTADGVVDCDCRASMTHTQDEDGSSEVSVS